MDIGDKIRRLRTQRGLTLEDLAGRSELSKGFLSQVERDLTSPSIATLTDILECLGTDLASFFQEDAPEKIVFADEDMFEKETEQAKVTWLVPNAQKNKMEPILVELPPGGQTEEIMPHEGEEFGYILSGSVLLHIGDKSFKARKGASFCFRPEHPHCIENPYKQPARLIWISAPPSF